MNSARSVFVLEDSSKSLFGGGQAITFQVCKNLHSQYRMVLFDTKKDTSFVLRVSPYLAQRVSLKTIGRINNLGGLNFTNIIEWLTFPLLLFWNVGIICHWVKMERKAGGKVLLYATTKKTLFYAFFSSILSRVPFVFHAHSYENGKGMIFQWKKFLYTKANTIIAVSQLVKEGLPLPHVTVIANPVELPLVLPKPKNIQGKKDFVVAAFAGLIPQKGLAYLMQSHSFLPDQLKNRVEIRIYGEGFYRSYLQQFVNSNVILCGFCENTEEVYQNEIDLTVVPSIVIESFGMTTIESFKYGIPVICTNQGGPTEIVSNEHNGFWVPSKDPKALADKISELLLNPGLYATFSANALEESKKYDVKTFIQNLSKIFGQAFQELP